MSQNPSPWPWGHQFSRGSSLIIIGAIALVIGVIFVSSALYIVNERELAVIVEFGKPVASRTEPGLYIKKPFVQRVRRLPKTKQFWRSTREETLVDLPTADGKKIEVSAWAIWKITDPVQFVQVMRDMENAERAVQVRVRSAIRDVITSHQLSEVVRSTDRELTYSFQFDLPDSIRSDGEIVEGNGVAKPIAAAQPGAIDRIDVGRETIMAKIKDKVRQELLQAAESREMNRGIELVDVGIWNISFVPAVREAAFERLKAFMESIASGYYNEGVQRKKEILNKTRAEVEKILGEGEKESSVIRGNVDAKVIADYALAMEETGDFYNFIRTLEVYNAALKGRTRLILTTDSDLFRLLKTIETDSLLESDPSVVKTAVDQP